MILIFFIHRVFNCLALFTEQTDNSNPHNRCWRSTELPTVHCPSRLPTKTLQALHICPMCNTWIKTIKIFNGEQSYDVTIKDINLCIYWQKYKVVSVHAIKVLGLWVIASLFLKFGIRWQGMVDCIFRSLPPATNVHLIEGWVGPRSLLGPCKKGEILCLS